MTMTELRSEHEWALDEDGEIDILAFDGDTHNGPRCVRCGYSYCHHCFDRVPKPKCSKLWVAPTREMGLIERA